MNEKRLYLQSWLLSERINIFGKKNHGFKNILLVKLDEIGDMVTSMHVFYMLHEQYPEASITLYCKPFNNSLFTYMDYVSTVNSLEDIGNQKFDLIVDLRGDSQTLEFAKKNKPKYRLDRGSIRLRNKLFGGQKNEILTNAQIMAPLIKQEYATLNNAIVVSEKERSIVESLLSHENIQDFVLIHVGSRQEVKKWPVNRFAKVISYINTKHNLPCILIGGKEDISANKECLSMVKGKNNFSVAGEFNLLQFAALCEKASLYIGNDSGPMHIASAANTPIIGLFSNAVKEVWYPLAKRVKIHHYFLAKNHTQQTVENSTIFEISVDEVQESVDALLEQST